VGLKNTGSEFIFIFRKMQVICRRVISMLMNRIKLILYGCLVLVASANASGFGKPSAFPKSSDNGSRTVYFEALGNGLLYSINYEARPVSLGNWQFGYRAGLGLAPKFIASAFNEDPFISIPLEFVATRGKSNHFFSLGYGVTYINRNPQRGLPHFFNILGIGYKYIPKDGPLFFKLQPMLLSPIQSHMKDLFFMNLNYSVGIGIGYTFGSKSENTCPSNLP